MLFNEPEVLAAIAKAMELEEATPVLIEAHERQRKSGKKAIPSEFPRVPQVVDIPEEDKTCPHDGTALEVIGAEKSEHYDYVPPQLRVIVQERLMYACPCCHQGVKVAPLRSYGTQVPPDLISSVTDEVMPETLAWQSRPLEQMYPVVFFDALRVKIRSDGGVTNKAV